MRVIEQFLLHAQLVAVSAIFLSCFVLRKAVEKLGSKSTWMEFTTKVRLPPMQVLRVFDAWQGQKSSESARPVGGSNRQTGEAPSSNPVRVATLFGWPNRLKTLINRGFMGVWCENSKVQLKAVLAGILLPFVTSLSVSISGGGDQICARFGNEFCLKTECAGRA
jgi:hypothetical protein